MNEIYPVAKLGDQVLIINKADIPYIGKARALDVKCIKVDLKYKSIDPIIELEKHLKFNPWEETTGDEAEVILKNIQDSFSPEIVGEKIVSLLTEALIKPVA